MLPGVVMAQIGAEAAAGAALAEPGVHPERSAAIDTAGHYNVDTIEDDLGSKPASMRAPKPPEMAYRKTGDYARVRSARKKS